MNIKNLIALPLILITAIGCTRSPEDKFEAELRAVKAKATQVEILNTYILYDNLHKRLGEPFLSNLIEAISVTEANYGSYFGGNGNTYLGFYDGTNYLFGGTVNGDEFRGGSPGVEGYWIAKLTPESQAKLETLFTQIGLTDEICPFPLERNVPAATNLVFRKVSGIPYTMKDAVLIMPDEHLSFGMTEYESGWYKIYYRDDQEYEDLLDIHFDTEEKGLEESQARLEINNNSSFKIQFDLSCITAKEVSLSFKDFKLDRNESLSIGVNPNVTCYVLGSIRNQFDSEYWMGDEEKQEVEDWASPHL
jgi:hypothetical protein